MTPQSTQKTPIAFIDRTGYVTPFNGIMDRTLDGWYIYDELTLQKAVEQQQRLTDERVRDEIGIIDVQYSVNDDVTDTQERENTPEFAKALFGVDKAVPFLNMGKQAPSMDLAPGEIPVIVPPPAPPAQVTTVDHLHVAPDNENLTEEELEDLSERALNPNQVAAAIMGL